MTSLRINTGRAIVGKIGSKERMEFTSIGESINLASRHQGATRHHADILVSEYSDVAARSRVPFEPIGQISIEGNADSARTPMIKIVS
jgi:adenylate cyclase